MIIFYLTISVIIIAFVLIFTGLGEKMFIEDRCLQIERKISTKNDICDKDSIKYSGSDCDILKTRYEKICTGDKY